MCPLILCPHVLLRVGDVGGSVGTSQGEGVAVGGFVGVAGVGVGGVDMLEASMRAVAAVNSMESNIECDITTLNLPSWQLQLIYHTLSSPSLLNPLLLAKAKLTHLEITPYLIYRYYASQQWGKLYGGQKYDTAIIANVNWRMQFGYGRGIHTLQTNQFAHLVHYGLGYTGW